MNFEMIKDIREAAGLSRRELCDTLSIPYRTLQSWELGDRECPPYVEKLIKFYLEHAKDTR